MASKKEKETFNPKVTRFTLKSLLKKKKAQVHSMGKFELSYQDSTRMETPKQY